MKLNDANEIKTRETVINLLGDEHKAEFTKILIHKDAVSTMQYIYRNNV